MKVVLQKLISPAQFRRHSTMTQPYCRLCLLKKSEYFWINVDFVDKIDKHLSLKVTENAFICKPCKEKVEAFDQFYHEVHKSHQQFEQRDEIRYIIVVKNNKTEIELKEVEATNEEQQLLTLIDIPADDGQTLEAMMQNETLETTAITSIQHETSEVENTNEASQASTTLLVSTPLPPMKLEGFPTELIKDGKLIMKGKELSKLIAKFYRLECKFCAVTKKFKKFTAMISHCKNEHSAKGFVTCCGGKISKIRQIAMHMARHIQPDAFQCPKCNKLLTCPKILQYHVQNHLPESERNLACPEPGCTRRFSYQSALVTHSVSHLPDEERTMFCCETCGRKFSTSGRLTAHNSMVHTKSTLRKEFTCEICSKKFLCKSNLAYHLTTHKNYEFQVECTVCKKWLKNKICLRKHMTIHSGIRHNCDKCDYNAANKQCLMNHKKVQHSDTKPFACEICDKTFKLKNTLTNHVNAQHNGLRKYSCEFCSKTFVSSGNYYAHRKRMHPKELTRKLQEKDLDEQRQRKEVQRKKLMA